ncbi:MAG TPA: ABC transporter ATP-binding protein [Streptosporangiaceae bacterium]|nr:ABC transporter ATP-binding protein [Streptosporangiaceae bacterium]
MSGLEIEGLRISIGEHDVLRAVDLHVEPGTCVGLVGESGSGKSLTALASIGLLPRGARVTAGRILLDGKETVSPDRDRTVKVRGSGIAMIFQSPRAALNPVLRVGHQVERVLLREGHHGDPRQRCVELLGAVGLLEPDKVARLYPHELSGGMCQRVVIAMGIASEPQILIADEPTTALDVTVQADILDLLDDLRSRTGMGMLLISHDLSVVVERCESISVMRNGEIVEAGTGRAVINSPRHPFTAELVRDLTYSSKAGGLSAQSSSLGPERDPAKEADW